MSGKRESERHVRDNAIQLEFRLYGQCPVQGEGTLLGHQLYFRARWNEWSFAVADSVNIDPVDIQLAGQGFLREGQCGEPNGDEASCMDYDNAEAIVRRCAAEYVAAKS
jgi:hypothetical protein